MKKKMLSLIGIGILTFSLAACGDTAGTGSSAGSNGGDNSGNNIESNTVGGDISATTEQENKENGGAGEGTATGQESENANASATLEAWETKVLADPAMEFIERKEVDFIEGVKVKMATTPFEYDIAKIEEAVRANAFLAQNYDFATKDSETLYAEHYQEGNFFRAHISNSIRGEKKDSVEEHKQYNDFYVSLGQNTTRFDNINSISISFSGLEGTGDLQEKIKGVLKDIVGEEMAEYLVYAKQSESDDNRGNLERSIQNESTEGTDWYEVTRDVEEEDGKWNVSFSIVANYYTRNEFEYYHGDYEPMINNAKYPISELTAGGIGDFDINNFDSFASDYMSIDMGREYYRTGLTSCTYSETTADNGEKIYYTSIMANAELADLSIYSLPSMDIQYYIYEKDGELNHIDVNTHGSNDEAFGDLWENLDAESDTYKKQSIDIMRQQMEKIIPNTDLNTISFEGLNSSSMIALDTTTTLWDKECDVEISTNASQGYWFLRINSKAE